jgi:hypothetical protein
MMKLNKGFSIRLSSLERGNEDSEGQGQKEPLKHAVEHVAT